MTRRDFFLRVEEDPHGTAATVFCLHRALLVALKQFAKIDDTEALERLAHLEADIMREIKNIAPRGVNEAEETRVMLVGHDAVGVVFQQVREALKKDDPKRS